MAKKLPILQIGYTDWSGLYDIPENLDWQYYAPENLGELLDDINERKVEKEAEDEPFYFSFRAILITDRIDELVLEDFSPYVDPYVVFQEGDFELEALSSKSFFKRKLLRRLPENVQGQPDKILDLFIDNLSPSPLDASRFKNLDMSISPEFTGEVTYKGFKHTEFVGEFGEDFTLLYDYRYNIGHGAKNIELWLEYEKEGDLEIELQVDCLDKGYAGVFKTYRFMEEEMKEPVILNWQEESNYYSLSLHVKGSGKLSVGNLYWRKSRNGLGQFLLGGERISDSHRQELIHYFHPGDMKPPLNIYFSGYRSAQGFEGYWMMRSMGAPFMLIGDPRLEGGSFYTGSDELETKLIEVIQKNLDYMGFTHKDFNLSGISMGSYGALYYASYFEPNAVIVGKPFTNLGDVARAATMKRPDEFETIMDVTRTLSTYGGLEEEDLDYINEKFWNKFMVADFDETKFAVAYMREDDYDGQAFPRLVENVGPKNVQLFGQGYTGRHNDNSRAINTWFLNEYHRVLREDFGRDI
ncbi:TPA: accessory Sec system protein Asp2 [Streptococcus agalactiae]